MLLFFSDLAISHSDSGASNLLALSYPGFINVAAPGSLTKALSAEGIFCKVRLNL